MGWPPIVILEQGGARGHDEAADHECVEQEPGGHGEAGLREGDHW